MTSLSPAQSLTLTRRFKAPRERVFAAFSSAEAMQQWFGCGPPHVIECSADFRVGGAYRISSYNPETSRAVVAVGVYLAIVPPSKITFTWKWEDDEDWAGCESLVTFEFKALGDETELHLTQTGFPSDESCQKHTYGWTGCLDKLDAVLAGLPAPSFKPCC
ncbi:SRPBCC domain-containing protein [Prosthecobacter sp.]|uniref:SRPBCC domain-containing protein n=1 Tax=Prosthecobacter sp. TaxID=1965333 RepID=UPI003783A4AE